MTKMFDLMPKFRQRIWLYEESGLFIVTYRHLYIKSIVVALDKAIITVFEMETST